MLKRDEKWSSLAVGSDEEWTVVYGSVKFE